MVSTKHKHVPLDGCPRCMYCWLDIIYDETVDRWYTEPEIDAYVDEQIAEAEWENKQAEWEADHPESRCPPRE